MLQLSIAAQPGLVQPLSFFAFLLWQPILPGIRLQQVLLAFNCAGLSIPENAERKTIQHNNKTAKNFIAFKYKYFTGIYFIMQAPGRGNFK